MYDSPFGKLSPELRNRIYELVLAREKPYRFNISSYYGVKQEIKLPAWKLNTVALPSACKSFHGESTALFYAANKFEFNSAENFKSFCAMIGDKNVAALRDVVVFVGGYSVDGTRITRRANNGRTVAEMAETRANVVDMAALLLKCSVMVEYSLHSELWIRSFRADPRELSASFAQIREETVHSNPDYEHGDELLFHPAIDTSWRRRSMRWCSEQLLEQYQPDDIADRCPFDSASAGVGAVGQEMGVYCD
ncbi:hypothetical protein LTR08_000942 [Meristemomyces frigidus]|nr:hypothetical protein LTR08_000942 [Meristemomyces frigidus]